MTTKQTVEERLSALEKLVETRLKKLEDDVRVVAEVVSATSDDSLRVCFVLQELESGGYLPELPWNLGTALVDLAHVQLDKKNGTPPKSGIPVDAVIIELEKRIESLRENFRKVADEQAAG